MIAATRTVAKFIPGMFQQRCFSHVLNLFCSTDMSDSMPTIISVTKEVTSISGEIKNTQRKNARFRERCEEMRLSDESSIFVTLPGEFVLTTMTVY